MWVTRQRAAEILGCSTNTVDRLLERGELLPRTGAPLREGSLNEDAVAALSSGATQSEKRRAGHAKSENSVGRCHPTKITSG